MSAPLDLAALSRLAAAADLPWEHDGGGEIVRAGLGSAGWVAETLHGGDPDTTRRYAEYIVAACNALPELIRMAREAERLREHSVTLNSIAWKIATALGDVPDGATQIEGNPVEQAERLVAQLADARAELEQWRATYGEEITAAVVALDADAPMEPAPRPSQHNPITKSYAIDQITDIEHLRRVAHRMWEAFGACHKQSAHIFGVLTGDIDCTECREAFAGERDTCCAEYQAWQRLVSDGFGSV